MHLFHKVEEPEPPAPCDWEGGTFCQHVALFVLFYFSCVLLFMASYSSFLQIYNGILALAEYFRKPIVQAPDVNASTGFSLIQFLLTPGWWVWNLLTATFARKASGKVRKRFRYPLQRVLSASRLRVRHGNKSGTRHKRERVQYVQSAAGELLCYLPYSYEHHRAEQQHTERMHGHGDLKLAEVWKSRHNRVRYRHLRHAKEHSSAGQGLKRSVSLENLGVPMDPRVSNRSPTSIHRRAR
eukprot:gi/632986661/ref/XP_007910361.1/ PREDICTED: uncharacterized protein LOC103191205 [Callorhinchus milii]